VSIGVALGACALALAANLHALSTPSANRARLAVALVAWPLLTGIPAFLVALAATSILNKLIYSPGNNGILVSWDPKSLVLLYDGSTQTVNLTVNVVFVGQVRFILELAFVQPLNLAA